MCEERCFKVPKGDGELGRIPPWISSTNFHLDRGALRVRGQFSMPSPVTRQLSTGYGLSHFGGCLLSHHLPSFPSPLRPLHFLLLRRSSAAPRENAVVLFFAFVLMRQVVWNSLNSALLPTGWVLKGGRSFSTLSLSSTLSRFG